MKSTNDKKGKQPTSATYLKTAYCKSKRLLKKEAKQASNENSNVKLLFELSWFRGLSVLVHMLASVVNRCKPCRHNLAIRTQQKLSGSVSRMASQETNLKASMMSWCDTSCANRTQHYKTMSSWFWRSHLLLWYVLWCRRPACGQVPRATRKSCKLSLPPKISDTLVLIGTGMCGTVWSVWVHESPKSRSWKCELIGFDWPYQIEDSSPYSALKMDENGDTVDWNPALPGMYENL